MTVWIDRNNKKTTNKFKELTAVLQIASTGFVFTVLVRKMLAFFLSLDYLFPFCEGWNVSVSHYREKFLQLERWFRLAQEMSRGYWRSELCAREAQWILSGSNIEPWTESHFWNDQGALCANANITVSYQIITPIPLVAVELLVIANKNNKLRLFKKMIQRVNDKFIIQRRKKRRLYDKRRVFSQVLFAQLFRYLLITASETYQLSDGNAINKILRDRARVDEILMGKCLEEFRNLK